MTFAPIHTGADIHLLFTCILTWWLQRLNGVGWTTASDSKHIRWGVESNVDKHLQVPHDADGNTCVEMMKKWVPKVVSHNVLQRRSIKLRNSLGGSSRAPCHLTDLDMSVWMQTSRQEHRPPPPFFIHPLLRWWRGLRRANPICFGNSPSESHNDRPEDSVVFSPAIEVWGFWGRPTRVMQGGEQHSPVNTHMLQGLCSHWRSAPMLIIRNLHLVITAGRGTDITTCPCTGTCSAVGPPDWSDTCSRNKPTQLLPSYNLRVAPLWFF